MAEDNKNGKPDLVKDKECIYCQKFYECKGKRRGVDNCINFEQYKD